MYRLVLGFSNSMTVVFQAAVDHFFSI